MKVEVSLPPRGNEAFRRLRGMSFRKVLDVGSGRGEWARIFRLIGKDVRTISLIPPADYVCDYLDADTAGVDLIWACHVLEHQRNVGLFLDKCHADLKEGGILAITVPPAKANIVGGHVCLWNPGLLLYNLILAGFDCAKAMIKQYGYNISVIVRKEGSVDKSNLIMDAGDIESIAHYFPLPVAHGFNGNLGEVNW